MLAITQLSVLELTCLKKVNAILLVSDPSLSSRRSVGDDPLSQSLQDWTLQKTNRSAENGSKVRCPKKLRIGLPVNHLFLERNKIQRIPNTIATL